MTQTRPHGPRQSASCESGFTLVESMVAMMILAIGLLALAAMQSMSLTKNVDSTELTRATNLGADMIERIHNNRQNVGQYAIDTSNGTPCPQSSVTQPMAKGDCDQWVQLLANPQAAGLQNIRGVIVVPPTPTGTLNTLLNAYPVTVTISWTGAAGEGKPARPKQVTLTTTVAPE